MNTSTILWRNKQLSLWEIWFWMRAFLHSGLQLQPHFISPVDNHARPAERRNVRIKFPTTFTKMCSFGWTHSYPAVQCGSDFGWRPAAVASSNSSAAWNQNFTLWSLLKSDFFTWLMLEIIKFCTLSDLVGLPVSSNPIHQESHQTLESETFVQRLLTKLIQNIYWGSEYISRVSTYRDSGMKNLMAGLSSR